MTRYGSYVVQEALGEGGLATVVRATDERDGRQVALKILSRDRRADVPGLRDRLLREADVLKGLAHIPAVVDLVEVFRDETSEADVLVLELVRGQTLGRRFEERRPDLRVVLEWMGHVCHAMHDIHAAGYVHRDIKPDNLLLTDDPQVPLKIIDFNSAGMASAASGNLTRVQGAFPHTPAYLPPECFDGIPPDESADVYALGMTFAELLLGRHPLLPGEDDTTTQSAWQRAHEDVPFPVLPGVPPALQGVLARCTAKDRSDRIPNAVVLWEELRSVWEELSAPPVVEAPAPSTGRKVAVAGLVGLALVTTLTTGLFGALWANAERQLAVAHDELDLHQRTISRLRRELAEAQKPAPVPTPPPKPTTLGEIGKSSKIADLLLALKPKLKTEVEKAGFGPQLREGQTAVVSYVLRLADGTEVDRSKLLEPIRFPAGGDTVIAGLSRGVIGMQMGERRRITVPPELGYADRGLPNIPPNSTLVMTVTLMGIE